MRILQVITTLELGGAEKLIAEISPLLQNIRTPLYSQQAQGSRNSGDVQVDVCVFDLSKAKLLKPLEDNGIKVFGFGNNGKVYSLSYIWKLAKLMKHYDVVHTHNTACQMFAAVASLWVRKPKLVTTEHSTSTRRRRYKIFKYIDRWMYSRYDKIICISEPSEDSLRAYIGNKYPIITIKNGVNIRKFMNATTIDLGLAYMNPVGEPVEPKKITMVAGFRYEKDQPTVIKALKYLPEDYHVVLVGDGAERANLENLVKNLELNERVHFLGLRNDVPNILKSSNVIVMSSHREGLSLSNVEGMCSGHPFVSSDVEGLREVTKGYGVLFPPGDSKALADILFKLCTEKEYADMVAAKCQERAKQYDIQKMVDDYQSVYSKLMNK